MKKKTYNKPVIKVISCLEYSSILAGSGDPQWLVGDPNNPNNNATGSGISASGNDDEFEGQGAKQNNFSSWDSWD